MMDFHVSLPPSDPCQRTPSRLSSRHPQSGNALQLLPACLAYLSAPLSGNAPESITLITVLGRGRRAQYRATSRRAPSSQTHTQQSSLHSSPKLSRPRQTSFSSSSIWAAAPGSLGCGLRESYSDVAATGFVWFSRIWIRRQPWRKPSSHLLHLSSAMESSMSLCLKLQRRVYATCTFNSPAAGCTAARCVDHSWCSPTTSLTPSPSTCCASASGMAHVPVWTLSFHKPATTPSCTNPY